MTTSSTFPRSSGSAVARRLGATPVRALWTGSADGDMRALGSGTGSGADGGAPTGSLPLPPGVVVHRLHQVHGRQVVAVGEPVPPGATGWRRHPDGSVPDGDALVTSSPRVAVSVLVADCAPVALGSGHGACGAVHAGWRGLRAGVLDEAVRAVRALGAGAVVAGVGPCIGPCCYEFSPDGIAEMSSSCGDEVGARTTWGSPSLDLRGAVRAVLRRAGVAVVESVDRCTACHAGYFSHRRRGDEARQALVVWREA